MAINKITERGIIFSAEMVRAILDRRKTMTRRLVKNPEYYGCPTGDCPHQTQWACNEAMNSLSVLQDCPYGPVGRRLWVREKFAFSVFDPEGGSVDDDPDNYTPVYAADPPQGDWTDGDGKRIGAPWRSPIHMPRWASRIDLEVTAIRCEPVQDISECDADAEGTTNHYACEEPTATREGVHRCLPVEDYMHKWNQLHAAPGTRWEDNPWVWAITFKKVEAGK